MAGAVLGQTSWRTPVGLVLTGAMGTMALVTTSRAFLLIAVVAVGAAVVSFVFTTARAGQGVSAVLALVIVILQRPASTVIGGGAGEVLGWSDDAVIMSLLVGIWLSGLPRAEAISAAFVGCMVVYALTGITGSILRHTETVPLLLGSWLGLKWPLLVVACARLNWSQSDRHLLRRVVAWLLTLHAIVAVAQVVAPALVASIFGERGGGIRLGIVSLSGIFDHPNTASTFLLFCICVSFHPQFAGTLWARTVAVVAAPFTILTLRLKAVLNLVVILVLRAIYSRSLVSMGVLPIAVLAGLVFASGPIAELLQFRLPSLFGEDGQARHALYKASVEIARDFFPWGAGFGSFGSEVSRMYYSDVYFSYGLSSIYGLTPEYPAFVTDAGWATIIGEAGLFGAVAFASGLASLWVRLGRRSASTTGSYPLPAFLFLTAILIDSIASPRLFDGMAAICLGVLLGMSTSGRLGGLGGRRHPTAHDTRGAADAVD